MAEVGSGGSRDTLSSSLVRLVRALPVSDADLEAAERCVRDWLGAMVAGGATPAGARLRAYSKRSLDLEARVFLAAALSHITETDDLHRGSTTHPACVVVPVALVLGRELGSSGRDALHAVLAGYDAMLRIGEALGPGHYRVFHNTATAGVFGAAAAAACLLDLEEEAWVWALGNAGTQAAGLWQFNEDATMSKHLHAGHAAQAGLRAALLAREGFTGPAAILEGDKGFFKGFCPDPIPGRVLERKRGWKLPETSFKPYPSCRHTHPAIDAALELRERIAATAATAEDVAEEVALIRIAAYPVALRFTDNPAPSSPYAARFSIQFCVAAALANGAPGLDSFEPMRLSDPQLVRLMARTAVEVDPELAARYPEQWGAIVEVKDSRGRVHTARRTGAKGDPENPLTDPELDDKVHDLLEHGGLERADAEALIRACRGLASGGELFPLPWIDAEVAAGS